MKVENDFVKAAPAQHEAERVTFFSWLKELNSTERNAMRGCFGGWALDAMDVQLYSLVIPTLIAQWSISRSQAGVLGTVALLLSAVGGVLSGYLCDRYGRVRVLQITILSFAVFTFLSGFAQNFEQMLICRALQGLGFGGEWAAGSVLMGEVIRARYRGRAVGMVQSGWSFGWGAGVLLYSLFFSLLPESIAWRVLFMTGLVPALLVLYLRRFIQEPPVFERTSKQQGERFISVLARPGVTRRLVFAALLVTGIQGSYYGVVTWLPTFLKMARHLSVFGTGEYLAIVICGNFAGFVIGAYCTDRIGRKKTFAISAIYGIVILYLYLFLNIDNSTMLWLGFPLGIASSFNYAPVGSYLAELFPTSIRATALGSTYNFGRAVGALFPALVGVLSSVMPLATAIGVFTIGGFGLMLFTLIFLPETRGNALSD